jgi:hypothetical protein
MRRATIGILALGAVSLAGCGGGAHFANKPRPPVPSNVTVYINNARVMLSPSSVGAGPVNFIITNQASQAESISIQPSPLGFTGTGPINPQATTEIQVNFKSPYTTYTVTTGSPDATTDASQATPSSIQSATFLVTAQRPNANSVLLQP